MIGSLFTYVPLAIFVGYAGLLVVNMATIFYPTLHVPYYTPSIPTPAFYHEPYYPPDQPFHLAIYVMDSYWGYANLTQPADFVRSNITLDRLNEAHRIHITLPESAVNNGSLYAHVYLYVGDDVASDPYSQVRRTYLSTYKVVESRQTRHLLHDQSENEKDVPETHFTSTLRVHLLNDRTAYPNTHLPGDISDKMMWVTSDVYPYLPLYDVDPLSMYRGQLLSLTDALRQQSEGVVQIPLTVELQTVHLGWFRLVRLFSNNFDYMTHPSNALRVSDKEVEQLKRMLADTDPWLLLLTMAAGLLHALFEYLAFKEDVQHWNQLENTEQVSRTAVVLDAMTRAVAVLYLWEKRAETSVVVLGGAAVSSLVAFWKLYKTRSIAVSKEVSEDVRVRQHVDATATRYIGLLAVPAVVGYAVHSLYFRTHASMRAYILDALMMFVYTLGFITLTPQLFLNYRLQSVEAMPIKVFLYRTLNTVVDDLFAWVMPMPTLTRIAAFRDDLVFIVLLWQWYHYPSRKAKTE
jgi:hypothetical protein